MTLTPAHTAARAGSRDLRARRARRDVLDVGVVLRVEPVADQRDGEGDGADQQADRRGAEGDAQVVGELATLPSPSAASAGESGISVPISPSAGPARTSIRVRSRRFIERRS